MKNILRWLTISTIVCILIIIPFVLFGDSIELWIKDFIDQSRQRPLAAGVTLGSLLAADIILPTPSSVISSGCGLLLGFIPGAITSATGMQLSCIFGFFLGKCAARPLVERWVGEKNADALERLTQRYGLWAIIITRPVPVLAEASTLFAGMGKMPFMPYMLVTALANIGISMLYAWAGSKGTSTEGLLLTFAAALLLPGTGMLLHRIIYRRKASTGKAEAEQTQQP